MKSAFSRQIGPYAPSMQHSPLAHTVVPSLPHLARHHPLSANSSFPGGTPFVISGQMWQFPWKSKCPWNEYGQCHVWTNGPLNRYEPNGNDRGFPIVCLSSFTSLFCRCNRKCFVLNLLDALVCSLFTFLVGEAVMSMHCIITSGTALKGIT